MKLVCREGNVPSSYRGLPLDAPFRPVLVCYGVFEGFCKRLLV